MKLLRCYIENFGKIHHYTLYFESGLTLVNENNGFGKSTVAAFIKAMFYGFPKSSRTLEKNERKRFTPWQGGVFGGHLDFSIDQKVYRIERTFGASPKEDHFRLFTLEPVSICNDFTENIGFEIFKMNADSFEKTVFMQQANRIDGFSTNEINSTMAKMVDDITDLESYHSALRILKSNRSKIVSNKGTEGSLKKINEDIHKTEIKLHQIKQQKDQLKRLQEEQVKINDAISHIEESNIIYNSISRHSVIFNEQDVIELEEIDSELSNHKNILKEIILKYNSIKKPMILPAIIALFLGSTLLLFKQFEWLFLNATIDYIFSMTSFLIMIFVSLYYFISFFQYKWNRKKIKNQMTYEKTKIRELQSKKSTLESQINSLQKHNHNYTYNNLHDSEKNILIHLNQKRISLYEEIAVLKHSLETVAYYEEKLEVLINERNRQLKNLKCLDKAIEHLNHAYVSLSSSHINTFKKRFDYYAKQIMDTSFNHISFDKEINPLIEISGIQRELPYFSVAEQTMIGLCIRLALIDILHPTEPLFIVMDDPFCSFDENNLSKVMNFLDHYAEKHQILYLTCHGSRI